MQYTVYVVNKDSDSTELWKCFEDKKEAKKYFQELINKTSNNIYLYDFINDNLLYYREDKGQPT